MRQSDVTSPVYFDDLQVSHTHSPVVQKGAECLENVRWTFLTKSQVAGGPFGLSFNSYSRAAITDQNFKFNAGSELEKMTDWYSTPFRKYDPSLGRFHGVDALAEWNMTVGPGQFAYNNPINRNDPTGLGSPDGDEENGGDSGGGSDTSDTSDLVPQGPPTAANMFGYDRIASAERGHGGNNGWATSISSGSLYANAFGNFSPNSEQHAAMKEAKKIAEAMNLSRDLTEQEAKDLGLGDWEMQSAGSIIAGEMPNSETTIVVEVFEPVFVWAKKKENSSSTSEANKAALDAVTDAFGAGVYRNGVRIGTTITAAIANAIDRDGDYRTYVVPNGSFMPLRHVNKMTNQGTKAGNVQLAKSTTAFLYDVVTAPKAWENPIIDFFAKAYVGSWVDKLLE